MHQWRQRGRGCASESGSANALLLEDANTNPIPGARGVYPWLDLTSQQSATGRGAREWMGVGWSKERAK